MYWYQKDVETIEAKPVKDTGEQKVVFYGSSSFTLWSNLEELFPNYNVVNLAFGGSTLAACAWFFKRIVPQHQPQAIFLYAGDNDISDGRTPEEVVLFFLQLLAEIRQLLGNIPVCYIAIKLSPTRKHLKGSIEFANNCIKSYVNDNPDNLHFLDLYTSMLDAKGKIKKDLYQPDGLHLSVKGYALWYKEIEKKLLTML
ncbi:MAG: GDSL family lipase [Bacteroidetes bacterium]|nr:MAG: GDSL family lipase [Bacteroidota bacterium]